MSHINVEVVESKVSVQGIEREVLITTSFLQGPIGATGPMGPTGPTGPQGPEGENHASTTTFDPSGNLVSDNVQSAIVEVDSEKVAKAGDIMTGPLTLPGDPINDLHAATRAFVLARINELIGAAPEALNTLSELSDALADDANFASTVTTALASKVDKATLDANTVLKADTNDTPTALAVPPSTIVGRKATGDIAALTATEVSDLGLETPAGAQSKVDAHAARLDDPHTLYSPRVGSGIAAAYQGIFVAPTQGIFALRMDDCPSADYTYSFPLLRARGLVATFGLIADRLNTAGHLTSAQALEMQQAGMQLAIHSKSHTNTPATWQALVDEIVTAKTQLQAAGDFYVDAEWIQPGTWIAEPQAHIFDHVSKLDSAAGMLLRASYLVSQAYVNAYQFGDHTGGLAGVKPLPIWQRHGAIPVTAYLRNRTDLTRFLDRAIAGNGAFIGLIHTADIGVSGRISVADFEGFLDDVKARVDAGTLVNMTTTSALMAQVRNAGLRNLIHDSTFEASAALGAGSTSATWVGWAPFGGAPPLGAEGTGKHGPTNLKSRAVTITNSTYLRHYLQTIETRSLRVQGWCRSKVPGLSGNARMIARIRKTGGTAGTILGANRDTGSIVTTNDWQLVRLCIGNQPSLGTPPTTSGYNDIEVWAYANAGNAVEWSDFEVTKI